MAAQAAGAGEGSSTVIWLEDAVLAPLFHLRARKVTESSSISRPAGAGPINVKTIVADIHHTPMAIDMNLFVETIAADSMMTTIEFPSSTEGMPFFRLSAKMTRALLQKAAKGRDDKKAPSPLLCFNDGKVVCESMAIALDIQRRIEDRRVSVRHVTWFTSQQGLTLGLFARRDFEPGAKITGPYQGTVIHASPSHLKLSKDVECLITGRPYVVEMSSKRDDIGYTVWVDNHCYGLQGLVFKTIVAEMVKTGHYPTKSNLSVALSPWNLSRFANHAQADDKRNNARLNMRTGALVASKRISAGTEILFAYADYGNDNGSRLFPTCLHPSFMASLFL